MVGVLPREKFPWKFVFKMDMDDQFIKIEVLTLLQNITFTWDRYLQHAVFVTETPREIVLGNKWMQYTPTNIHIGKEKRSSSVLLSDDVIFKLVKKQYTSTNIHIGEEK